MIDFVKELKFDANWKCSRVQTDVLSSAPWFVGNRRKMHENQKNLFNNGSASIGGAWSICFIDNGTMCWCVGATKKRAHHQQFPLVKASNFWSPKRLLCNGRRDLGFLKFDSCPLARCPNIQNGSFAVTVHGRKTNIFLWARFSFAFCLSMSCWLAREISRR